MSIEDMLIDLLIGFESTYICEEMDSYELNNDNESWCFRNCKYSCPQKECYLKYLEFVRNKNEINENILPTPTK